MSAKSRTKKTALNSLSGILFGVISSLLSFALNAYFIRLLGLEYAGINSLFSSILNLLNIADLGISNAILFRLYKKIAEGDDEGICLMLTTYKRICYAVAGIILIGGLCCIPFLDHFVKDVPKFPESLWSLFIIVLATSVVTHAFDYTKQILTAQQDQYISTVIKYLCKYLTTGLQLLFLFIYKNIYVYLLIALTVNFIQYAVYAIISHSKYNANWNSKEHITKSERKQLTKDVGSLAVYKFCRTLDATVDTLLIGKFVAVATTAIFSSACVIITFFEECFGNINDGMLASIGDLSARNEKDSLTKVFYQSMHFTFLIFGAITITLVAVLSPLMKWWIGYTLSDTCIYLMIINSFMGIFGNHVSVYRNSMGIFVKGWKRPVFTALFNLIFSLILVVKIGLIGTLIGTTISRVLTTHWYDPWLVCKYGLDRKPFKYYLYFILYIIIAIVISFVILYLNSLLPAMGGFFSILWHSVLYGCVSLILLVLIGFLFPEQKPLFNRLFSLVKPVISKINGK